MNQVKSAKSEKKSKATPAPVVETTVTTETSGDLSISTSGDLTGVIMPTIKADTGTTSGIATSILVDEFGFEKVTTPDLSLAPETVAKIAEVFGIGKVVANPPTAWETTDTGYPEPTVITIDENTDLSKIADMAQDFGAPKVRRVAIGIKMFLNEGDFLAWQKEEPREVFEITPTAVTDGRIKMVIFVTYANGIIE